LGNSDSDAAPMPAPHLKRFARADFARLSRTQAYDLVMRVPILIWATLVASIEGARLTSYVTTPDPTLSTGLFAVTLASRVALLLFLFSIALFVVGRSRPSGKARGLEPRISALLGSFLPYAMVLFPRQELSLAMSLVSTLLLLIGNGFAIYAIARLGRSFSVMAEARQLVTGGAYRFVRHPLYLAEEIAVLGAFLQFASLPTALLLAGQIAFQLRRMRNEERVLAEQFPEYAIYRSKTARLIPGLY
jgi:protein-S-isoprenylcysteine O-methyltransferase Ste14